MKCFPYSFYKIRKKVEKSSPVSKEESKSDNSATDHVVTSSSAASARSIPELYEEKAHNLRVFSMKELRAATCDFSRLLKIGEGGFGCVYKGSIKPQGGGTERTVVAVKMLKKDGYQGHKQWLAEVHFLGVVEHANLVKLIGYCGVDDERGIERLLVYEYMENRSLDDHLFNNAYPVLPWETRLQIALGSAQGLAYLHEELEVQVIFRDFKASNVLLDKDFRAKLSDFGLAREGPTEGKTHVSTAVVGTHGYAAPDYIETGRLTTKSDVWSFGMVLYEMLTGRRSLDRNRPKPEQKLLEWVQRYPSESKRFVKIMDTRLGNSYSVTVARKIANLADSCLLRNAKDRPKMSKVVESLKQILYSEEDKSSDRGENDKDDPEEVLDPIEPSESTLRRLKHLTRLGEHVGDISRRGLMIMRRARVA